MNEQVKEIVALHKKICRKAGVTIRDHQMLEPGDNILLGLSGGKDSMIMLEVMAERRASLPFNFDLTAAHIHIETAGYTVNRVAMESLCQKLNVPFVWKEAEIEPVGKKEKGICFLCSWNRRKSLFDLARELDAGKLALGHHRYDALETMLINMMHDETNFIHMGSDHHLFTIRVVATLFDSQYTTHIIYLQMIYQRFNFFNHQITDTGFKARCPGDFTYIL